MNFAPMSDKRLKRSLVAEETPSKHQKLDGNTQLNDQEEIRARKRKNFITACERVSCKAYFDQRSRLHLVYLPACANRNEECKHQKLQTKQLPCYAEESFKIDMKSNTWSEALEVCIMSITAEQYLSANVLRDIVEIILNAHEDEYAEQTIPFLMDKCLQILSLNYSTHPPCHVKSLRQCYINFLTSPMELRDHTFTNRSKFGCDKGIVKYCMNRLEHELCKESNDSALIDKHKHIPEEIKETVKGLHWQKEKLEIFEFLQRTERIQRLMYVLGSLVELIQFDLAIWHTRYTSNLGLHVMRSHKPLMAHILWSNNVLFTGTVTANCLQILRIFIYFVHLNYPEDDIRIMTAWLNTTVQTFYMCETNSSGDYPNTGKYCAVFAREFYKIISDMPSDSIMNILQRIQPAFMKNLVGMCHIKQLLNTQESNVIKVLMSYIKNKEWLKFPENGKEIILEKNQYKKPNKVNKILSYLIKKLNTAREEYIETDHNPSGTPYPKFDGVNTYEDKQVDQNHVLVALYVTLEAYLDAYSVQEVQDTLDGLNEHILEQIEIDKNLPSNPYTVSENFIKHYRSLYQMLKDLMLLLLETKKKGELPSNFKIFDNIGLLGM